IYGGLWFTPLREALSAFVDSTQKTVTGKVRLKLYKGGISSAGASSPYSLYNANLASFTTGDLYNHADAKGFIRLYGLPVLVRSLLKMSGKAAPVKEAAKPKKALAGAAGKGKAGAGRGAKPKA
ncbi:MAG: argininosuccinate synthase, partial [Treponema sp.]|nr:argininosuccinate synthase [Treponema sp.]